MKSKWILKKPKRVENPVEEADIGGEVDELLELRGAVVGDLLHGLLRHIVGRVVVAEYGLDDEWDVDHIHLAG